MCACFAAAERMWGSCSKRTNRSLAPYGAAMVMPSTCAPLAWQAQVISMQIQPPTALWLTVWDADAFLTEGRRISSLVRALSRHRPAAQRQTVHEPGDG